MKKNILLTLAVLITFTAGAFAQAKLGYQGENPIKTTEGTATSTTKFGHRGENPTTNPNWKKQQQKKYGQRKKWQQKRQGIRAGQGSTVRNIVY